MAIARASVTVKGSEHEVVFSHDDCVTKPRRAGWLPLVGGPHDGVIEGVDKVTVRWLSKEQLAALGDLDQTPDTAHLMCLHYAVAKINGKPVDTHREYVQGWIDGVYREQPDVVRSLSLYVRSGSRGEDAVERLHPAARRAYGHLPCFPDPLDVDAAQR